MPQKAQTILSRTLLLAGYVAFFVVQVYCNIGAIQSCFHTQQRLQKNARTHTVLQIKNTQSPDHEKVNVLVNKRFHPENTLAVAFTLPVPPTVYIPTTTTSIPVSHLYIASVLTRSLRAPPAA